jgi:D-lactate dehydrogenase
MQALPVMAAELMDRAALGSVEKKPGIPTVIRGLDQAATALLVETQADAFDDLSANVQAIADALENRLIMQSPDGGKTHAWQMTGSDWVAPAVFTDDAAACDGLWKVRKGLLPSVGAVRRLGSTVIIEDVAFPIDHLAPATLELQTLLDKHGYDEAIIFGHALAGNLHFVFSPNLGLAREVDRYARFMDDIVRMVVDTFDGSLKAEHGTGRNMAPFVEKEWGHDAYTLMKEIKSIFDPYGLLNPGVILNPNPKVHLHNLKPLPPADPLVDACMECGFCECRCPSRNLSLTPRQRIVIQREIARLVRTGENPSRLAELKKGYRWQGEATCAADGLCGVACPVDVDTGTFTKTLRARNVSDKRYQWLADWAADHFDTLTRGMRAGLTAAHRVHQMVGPPAMHRIGDAARRLSRGRLPAWLPSLPTAAEPPRGRPSKNTTALAVVYFPACVSRTMGPGADDPLSEPLHRVARRVLERAGYRVVYPEGIHALCCGLPFESKGFFEQADRKSAQLEKALLAATLGGRLPVLCDTSPCLERMRRTFSPRLNLFEPVEFVARFILNRLTITRVKDPIALHITCSARKMNIENAFMAVADTCAETVVVPHGIDCCGFAGDRGFNVPELNASALKGLKRAVSGCTAGYANSRTCEIGLSEHSGIPYRSIMVLVDQCTA